MSVKKQTVLEFDVGCVSIEFKKWIALYENIQECDNFSDSEARQTGFALRDHV
jgi:hypothetical protein